MAVRKRKNASKPVVRKPSESIRELKMCLYGIPGIGKTHLLGTATQMPEFFGKCLLIAPDPGDLTLVGANVNEEYIDVAPVHTWQEVDDWYEFLDTTNRETNEYQTVMLDGISDFVEMMLLQILKEDYKADSSRKSRWKPDLPQWGKVNNVTRECLRIFRDLPMHVIFTALEREMKDEATGLVYFRPGVRGSLANDVGGYFDILGHLSVPFKKKYTDEDLISGITRTLTVQNIGKAAAKDRSGKLGLRIENPTLPMMVEMMQSDTERGAAPPTRANIKQKKFN